MTKRKIRALAVLAMLTALEIVLSRFLSISLPTVKIGFSFLAVAFAAREYGPWGGVAVAAAGDFVGAHLFPIGPYFVGFTVTAALCGLLYGRFSRSMGFWDILVVEVINNFILGGILNSIWISVLYDKALLALIPVRMLQATVMTVVGVLTLMLMKRYIPHINKQ